jgi:hypothetical protein
MQHDLKFQQSYEFIFLLADQLRRHQTARAVGIQVRNDATVIDGVNDAVTDPVFIEALELTGRPGGENSEAAKIVLDRVGHLINKAGASVSFGPLAAKTALSKLYALTVRFGCPTHWVTSAPSDVNFLPVIKTVMERTSPLRDEMYEDFVTTAGDDPNFETVRVPIYDVRNSIAVQNPGLVTAFYCHQMFCIRKYMYGGQPASVLKKSVLPGSDVNVRGAFGPGGHNFTVQEAQGRGALHHHGVHYGCLSSRVMGSIVHDAELMELVCLRCLIKLLSLVVSVIIILWFVFEKHQY